MGNIFRKNWNFQRNGCWNNCVLFCCTLSRSVLPVFTILSTLCVLSVLDSWRCVNTSAGGSRPSVSCTRTHTPCTLIITQHQSVSSCGLRLIVPSCDATEKGLPHHTLALATTVARSSTVGWTARYVSYTNNANAHQISIAPWFLLI